MLGGNVFITSENVIRTCPFNVFLQFSRLTNGTIGANVTIGGNVTNGTIGSPNGTIGKPNGINSNIMINTSNLFSYSYFYVYISVFLLFAYIILIKTVLICEIYKFKV